MREDDIFGDFLGFSWTSFPSNSSSIGGGGGSGDRAERQQGGTQKQKQQQDQDGEEVKNNTAKQETSRSHSLPLRTTDYKPLRPRES